MRESKIKTNKQNYRKDLMRISHRLIKYLKFKNVLIDFNIRLENANESVSEPGEKSAEINQSEE